MSILKNLVVVTFIASLSSGIFAKDEKKTHHCETKVSGKHVDLKDVASRKDCKDQGGKWVRNHEHDHDHSGGADHSHSEE